MGNSNTDVKEALSLNSEQTKTKHKEFLFPSVANYYEEPLAIERGEGMYLYDPEGNKYLDFFGGILTVSVGHCNPKVTNKISNFSDHWPFYVHGIPTTKFHDLPVDPRDMRYSHTTADTVDKVDAKGLKDASLLLALCLLQIANEETLPFNHQSIGKIKKRLEENGIAENLKMAGVWRREFPP